MCNHTSLPDQKNPVNWYCIVAAAYNLKVHNRSSTVSEMRLTSLETPELIISPISLMEKALLKEIACGDMMLESYLKCSRLELLI